MKGLIAILSLLALAPSVKPDRKGRKEVARELLKEGNQLFTAKKYAAALSRFEKAYDLYPSSKLLFNLASSHEALDHDLVAAEFYDRFLVESGFDSTDRLVKEAKERLRRLDRSLSRIAIDPGPPGTKYQLDDQPADPVKQPLIRVLPGPHRVTASREGHQSATETMELLRGEKKQVKLALLPLETDPPPAPPQLAPPPPPNAALVVETSAAESESEPITRQWWFWTVIAGVAVVAAGTTAGVVVATRRDFEIATDDGSSSISDWETP